MKETDQAQQAFLDYYALGPDRSLSKLVDGYQSHTESAPTKQLSTLKKWSTAHDWQARIMARVEEDAEVVRKELRERAIAFRRSLAGAIEVDVRRRLERLRATEGTVLAESAADVEKLGKLYFQLTGQPLADRTEVTAAEGKPLDVTVIFGVNGHDAKTGDMD